MAIKFGDSTPSAFYLGGSTVSALYQGTTQVWPAQQSYLAYSYNSKFDLGTAPFTLEWWQYRTATALKDGDEPRVFSLGTFNHLPSDSPVVYSVSMEPWTFDEINTLTNFYINSQASGIGIIFPKVLNAWQHFAICRNSSNAINYYCNGVRIDGASYSTNFVATTGKYLTIGRDHTGSANFVEKTPFPGYITNLHIATECKYNPGGGFASFTPPTSPITPTANTKLLLLATDNASAYTDSSTISPATPAATRATQWSSLSPYAGGVGGSIAFNQ